MRDTSIEIGIGVLGFGTVGAGVVQTLLEQGDLIAQRTGVRPVLRRVVDLDITTDRGVAIDPALLTTQADDVLNDPDIHIVVELVGGLTVAKQFILQALRNGKAVVTANKALLAEDGHEIFETAEANGVDLYYEASVAGGIPVIKALREGLVANRISRIYGILNGTCNYILTRMEQDGLAFDEVLKEAQDAGYAEAEPSLDIDGLDTAHKAVLLASLAFGREVRMEDLFIQGIRGFDPVDIGYASELGYRIKLLAVLKEIDGAVMVRVQPTLLPHGHMLAEVNGVFNAVMLVGDIVGPTLYYGAGAGRYPTASAVVADVVEVARNRSLDVGARLPAQIRHMDPPAVHPVDHSLARHYLRLNLLDQPGTLAQVTGVLSRHNISISAVLQKDQDSGASVPVVILTHEARERDLNAALEEIAGLEVAGPGMVRMMVEEQV